VLSKLKVANEKTNQRNYTKNTIFYITFPHTFYGAYLSMEVIRSMASLDAFGMTSFNDYGLHYGKVYPTVLANYQPSGHSSFVGVPSTLHI